MKSLTVAVAFVVLFSYTFVVLFSIAKLKVLTLVQGNFNRIGVFGLTINLLGRLDATEMQFAAEKVDKPLSQAEVKRSNDPPFHSVHLSRAPPYFHTPCVLTPLPLTRVGRVTSWCSSGVAMPCAPPTTSIAALGKLEVNVVLMVLPLLS
jgi:hypothetical protein